MTFKIQPLHEPTDILYNKILASALSEEEALKQYYGDFYYANDPVTVYTDGSCLGGGTDSAQAGAGICYGLNSRRNQSVRVPGPGRQTNNRAESYSVYLVLFEMDPKRPLIIYTDSEYIIRQCCYWAGRHLATGWNIPNGDILKDIALLLKERAASTRFVWVKGHSGNQNNDEADNLAKKGATMDLP
ncbi:MAG: ribonuclease H-like domain-containing protein, partial [Lentinula lateritia]